MSKLTISQQANFKSDFGLVHRGSAIFYFKNSEKFKTTFSLLDYWSFKRNLKVGVVASIRGLNGKLLKRESLDFNDKAVLNYHPNVSSDFEGSVELEAFSATNLEIPYSAFMAVYETPRSISMVHSYTRTYSRHEVEEGRTISIGEESCWTIRDSNSIRSFGIFHNGASEQPAQTLRLIVKNEAGEVREADIALPALSPFATTKIYPYEHIQQLPEFLKGGIGNASLSFHLSESFTRMLVGNEAVDGSDFQITHSNFNYSQHKTDSVAQSVGRSAFMLVPKVEFRKREILVYPDSDPGQYSVAGEFGAKEFRTGEIFRLPLSGDKTDLLTFTKKDGALPSRIVTAMTIENPNELLPAECSLGVMHGSFRKRHTRWGLCAATPEISSAIVLDAYEAAYGKIGSDDTIEIKLYSKSSNQPLIYSLKSNELSTFRNGKVLETIFPEAKEFLGNDFGYFVVQSSYGGLLVDSWLKNANGDLTYEHAF